jgi:hypothetical protein
MSTFLQISTAAVLLGVATAASPAAAQCPHLNVPSAGSWASYHSDDGTMRMAILGNETRDGKSMLRMELSRTSKDGPMIMQLLVPGYPYEMTDIHDLVMKAQGRPAMRMNDQMLAMMRSRMPKDVMAEACSAQNMTRVGEESVTVPAGTFQTTHYRNAESGNDVWLSTAVPFGLVKNHSGNGGDIVLTGTGTDAKSQITETPQEMPGMGGMPHN